MDSHNARAGESLREALKDRTRGLHDTLDAAIGGSVLTDEDHAAFLRVQHAARAPIEAWVAAHMPDALRPPATTPLIAADLSELGAAVPADEPFAFPASADHLGLAWALGGSALGNKALLTRRRRAGRTGANRFLGDGATAAYFRAMIPLFARSCAPREVDAAVEGATAVFDTFLAAVSRNRHQAAA